MSNIKIIRNARGVTAFELLVTVSIVSVLLALSIPSFSKMMDKQRLTGECNVAYEQLMLARTTAVKMNQNVSISFKSQIFDFDQDGDGVKERYSWCIGLSDAKSTGCNCAGSATEVAKCKVGGRAEAVRFEAASNVAIYNNDVTFSGKDKTTFNSRDGTAAAGRISIASKSWVCRLIVSSVGRIRFAQTKAGQAIVPLSQASKLQ